VLGRVRRIDTSSRLVSLDSLLEQLERWRAASERVVAVVGAFDLPHAEHARRLAEARLGADRLAALVQDDFWVASELGPGSPVSPATDRARVVCALRAVDAALILLPTDLARLRAALPPGESWHSVADVDRERMTRLRGGAA
jgi:bifunctional ADP-heptose synthase (sugar kinase/adenylyltransferase)